MKNGAWSLVCIYM